MLLKTEVGTLKYFDNLTTFHICINITIHLFSAMAVHPLRIAIVHFDLFCKIFATVRFFGYASLAHHPFTYLLNSRYIICVRAHQPVILYNMRSISYY